METLDFQKQLDRIEAAALGQKNVLNFSEACRFTGLSSSHLYKLTSTQQVPYFKPNQKLIYFDRVEIEKWLLQNRIPTTAEIEQQAANYIRKGGIKK
jgi:predicted DNA-binding transcriptional regulator AlpA